MPEIGTPGLRWRGLETAYGKPKRARSWKRRIQPRGAYGALRQSSTLLKTEGARAHDPADDPPSGGPCDRIARPGARPGRGAGAHSGLRLDSRPPSSTEVLMRLIGLAVVLALDVIARKESRQHANPNESDRRDDPRRGPACPDNGKPRSRQVGGQGHPCGGQGHREGDQAPPSCFQSRDSRASRKAAAPSPRSRAARASSRRSSARRAAPYPASAASRVASGGHLTPGV